MHYYSIAIVIIHALHDKNDKWLLKIIFKTKKLQKKELSKRYPTIAELNQSK